MSLYSLDIENEEYLDRVDPALLEFVTSRDYDVTGRDILDQYRELGLEDDEAVLRDLDREKQYRSPDDVFKDLLDP